MCGHKNVLSCNDETIADTVLGPSLTVKFFLVSETDPVVSIGNCPHICHQCWSLLNQTWTQIPREFVRVLAVKGAFLGIPPTTDYNIWAIRNI